MNEFDIEDESKIWGEIDIDLVKDMREAKERRDQADAEYKAASKAVAEAMLAENYDVGTVLGKPVVNLIRTQGFRFDTKKFKAAAPDLYRQYEVPTSTTYAKLVGE